MSGRGCGCIERACSVPVLALAVVAAVGTVLSLAAPRPEHAAPPAGQRWAVALVQRLLVDHRPVVARIGPAPMDAG